KGVAGSGEKVDSRNGLRTAGHGSNGLDTTEEIDFVGSSKMHGCDGCIGGFASVRWGTGNDAFDAYVRIKERGPATLAVRMVMCADASKGYRPPGMYAPTES